MDKVGDVVAFRKSDSIVGRSLKARVVDIQHSGKASFWAPIGNADRLVDRPIESTIRDKYYVWNSGIQRTSHALALMGP